MFKRTEEMRTDNDYGLPAKRAKFSTTKADLQHGKVEGKGNPKSKNVQYDDIWGDDFNEEDIEEIDLVASQACLQADSMLNNLHPIRLDLPGRSIMTADVCNETPQMKLPLPREKTNHWMKKDIQSTSRDTQDVIDINYSQFKNKLIDSKNHNSTFHKGNNFIISDDKELEKLRNENKKLLDNFITKDGENVFLRQQLQQNQLRVENEKLEKMRLMEEQANRHRTEINNICKEKELLKTQLELQNLEIGSLLERCKLLEYGNIKLQEPQPLHVNTSIAKNRCNTSINRSISTNTNLVKDVCMQVNTFKKSDYQLKTWNTYFPLVGISEIMCETSLPEKPIINIKITEKTGKRNLPILQEEETFRIFENPDLAKPIVTIVDGKNLTTEFILLEITTIEQKNNKEIDSESCIPIINKIVLIIKELMLNVITILQTIFQAMRNDDIRDMNDLYFSTIYKDHGTCIKSECEAGAWYEDERGIEIRRILGVLLHIALESSYLSAYLAGKSPLFTRNDTCYNHYLQQMTRYNEWSQKDHQFEMLNLILEFVTLIGRVRRAHQFTGVINAILKVLCNVQKKINYCEKGLEYVYFIFKEIVFSRPLSLCYVTLVNFIMVFSKCSVFVSMLCRNSKLMTIKRWKGALHFTPDACVLQILIAQMEHFYPDFLATVNITYALISFVQYLLHINNNLLRNESSESCNCYMKLLRFTINMLTKCSETRLDVIDYDKWQDPFHLSKKCYTLIKINYKDCAFQTESNIQNMEQDSMKTYPKKLDWNFWSDVRKTQHKVLKEGITFFCHLAICDPDFIIRSSDIEDSFHLFIRNIASFNVLILNENEREALNRIKTTFIVDKSPHTEIEIHQKSSYMNQLSMKSFKKKAIPSTNSYRTQSTENFNRKYMAIKALYNAKA